MRPKENKMWQWNTFLAVLAALGVLCFFFAKNIYRKKADAVKTGGAIVAVVAIAAMAFGGWGIPDYFATPSTAAVTPTPGAGGTQDCSQNPTLGVSATDALNPGSIVVVTPTYRVNGSLKSATFTNFKAGDKVETLINSSGYLTTTLPEVTLGCGANSIDAAIYKYAAAANVAVFTDLGTTQLTDAATGGAVNETAYASGGTKTWKIQFSGTDKASTGKLLYVVELGSDANVSSIILTDALGAAVPIVSIPSGADQNGAGLHRVGFEIPTTNAGTKQTFYLSAQANTGKTIAGAVYSTWYVEQNFVQTDGTFAYGSFDKLSAPKYQATYDYDWFVTA